MLWSTVWRKVFIMTCIEWNILPLIFQKDIVKSVKCCWRSYRYLLFQKELNYEAILFTESTPQHTQNIIYLYPDTLILDKEYVSTGQKICNYSTHHKKLMWWRKHLNEVLYEKLLLWSPVVNRKLNYVSQNFHNS